MFGASKNDEETKKRKDEIGGVWEVKNMGENDYFLGMRVQQDIDQGAIQLTQQPYGEHIINQFNVDTITPHNTPLPASIILNSDMCPKTDSETKAMHDKPFCSILRSVMWGQLATH